MYPDLHPSRRLLGCEARRHPPEHTYLGDHPCLWRDQPVVVNRMDRPDPFLWFFRLVRPRYPDTERLVPTDQTIMYPVLLGKGVGEREGWEDLWRLWGSGVKVTTMTMGSFETDCGIISLCLDWDKRVSGQGGVLTQRKDTESSPGRKGNVSGFRVELKILEWRDDLGGPRDSVESSPSRTVDGGCNRTISGRVVELSPPSHWRFHLDSGGTNHESSESYFWLTHQNSQR